MIKINYESDFKLVETVDEYLLNVPFTFTYTTNEQTYTASYNGETYVNCKRNSDGSIVVIFNKHGLGVGKMKVRREFLVTDVDFPDGVYNVVSNDTTDVLLVEGKTEGIVVSSVVMLPNGNEEGGGTTPDVPDIPSGDEKVEIDLTNNTITISNMGGVSNSVLTLKKGKVESNTLYL